MTTRRWIWLGILGGLLGGVLESLVVMVNAAVVGQSIFTPMHMVATPIVGMAPMEAAMQGGTLYMEPIPAFVGMVGHFMWSALWGALFGLIAAGARLTSQAALWSSPIYGIGVGLFMSAVVLPIFQMQPMWLGVGWPVFLIAHAAYGLGPGLVIWRGTRAVVGTPAIERHARAA
jgi:uncharacterized membrane protein YagU involved in acid resistance